MSLNKQRVSQQEERLYFDKLSRSYVLIFKSKTINLRLCEFIALHQKLSKLDLVSLVNDLSHTADNHNFVFEKRNISLHLNLIEVIILRKIISEAMFNMRLEDMLYQISITLPVEKQELRTILA